MLDAKMISDLEQSAALSAELLKSTYEELKERFSEEKAWELIKVVVFALYGGKGMLS